MTQQAYIHALWARSDRYKTPQFIAAWSDGLVDSWTDWYHEKRDAAISEYVNFSGPADGPWTFWMTVEEIAHPTEVHDPIWPREVPDA